MEPTNIKVGEYVGVYHDSNDGSFHFDTISAEEYDWPSRIHLQAKACFIGCWIRASGTYHLI